jgi:hypothetical protein
MLVVARVAAIVTTTLLIAFTVVIDALGRLIFDPTFHVSEIIFGSLIAAWLGLLGLESISFVRSIRNGSRDGQ